MEEIVRAFRERLELFGIQLAENQVPPGMLFRIPGHDPLRIMQFLQTQDCSFDTNAGGISFAMSVPVDIREGIQGRIIGTFSFDGGLSITPLNFIVMQRGGERFTATNFNEAAKMARGNSVTDVA